MSEGIKIPNLASYANGTLCEFCDSTLRGSTIPPDVRRSDCIQIESLADHCIICAIIFHTASKSDFPPTNTWPYIKYTWTESSSSDKTMLLSFWTQKDDREDLLGPSIHFSLLDKASEQFNLAYIGSNKQSTDDWALIETWMQSCLHDHQACNQPKTSSDWHPTRLLELDDLEFPKRLRLREGEEIPPSTRYTTLSHCWGLAQLVTLTTDNKADMMKGITLDALPKTFKEAVTITSRLKVKYLWIDSLCIIQNSREDWAKESGLMCSVYGNSYCNISATAASNSSEGCFTANPKQFKDANRPFCVRIDWDGWENNYCAYHMGEDIWDELEKAPLNTRAWVHQERLLSPRVIHFGLSQLAWECNETRIAELSPIGTSEPARGIREFSKQRCSSLWDRRDTKAPLRSKEFLQKWSFIWSKYASLRLTHETDRLVALTGVVEKIQPKVNVDFLAGLWRRDLEQQLCWYTRIPRDKPAKTYIAPSWSWASLPDRRADQDWAAWEDEKITLLKVIDTQIRGDPDGPKHAATGGFVRARCYLVPATRIHGQWTRILVFSPAGDSTVLDLHLYLDCEEDNKLPHIWCAPVVAINNLGSEDSFGGSINGLLLEKLENGGPSAQNYRRCGYFMIQDSWRGNNTRAFWNAVFYFDRHQTSPERHDRIWRISEEWLTSDSALDDHLSLYKEEDSVVQHTITIW